MSVYPLGNLVVKATAIFSKCTRMFGQIFVDVAHSVDGFSVLVARTAEGMPKVRFSQREVAFREGYGMREAFGKPCLSLDVGRVSAGYPHRVASVRDLESCPEPSCSVLEKCNVAAVYATIGKAFEPRT